jgi:hypothetical protein
MPECSIHLVVLSNNNNNNNNIGEVEVPVTKPVDLWQLNESSAKAYELYLVPLFFAQGARSLIELVPLKGGERVLDVAY